MQFGTNYPGHFRPNSKIDRRCQSDENRQVAKKIEADSEVMDGVRLYLVEVQDNEHPPDIEGKSAIFVA